MHTEAIVAAAPYLIRQEYGAYTAEQHELWAELVRRVFPDLESHASRAYLEGFEFIGLQESRLPDLKAITARLGPRTGWHSTPVSGFLPASAFFEMLSLRRFPTTTWLRDRESLDYTPEPDIFHDVFGHVPMHATRCLLIFFSTTAACALSSPIPAVLEKLGRLFWYTVEFGVILQNGEDQGLRQRADQLARRNART
jgi:phenylalanine-4-hydroxylase